MNYKVLCYYMTVIIVTIIIHDLVKFTVCSQNHVLINNCHWLIQMYVLLKHRTYYVCHKSTCVLYYTLVIEKIAVFFFFLEK